MATPAWMGPYAGVAHHSPYGTQHTGHIGGISGSIRRQSSVSRRGVPMEDRTFAEAQLLSAQLLYGRITRRAFLRRAAVIGLSASTITMILDACGGGSTAPTATSSAPQA